MEIILNIVHPCYNPKDGWEKKFVENHRKLMQSIPPGFVLKLILVNDGSTEGINQQNIRFIRTEIPDIIYIHHPLNSGKGFALRSAMKEINQGLVIYTDADNPYTLKNTLEMLSALCSGDYDVVVGVRTFSYFKKLPLTRLFLSYALRIANFVFFPRLFTKDTQSGLKGFNQKGKDVFLKTKINGFLSDMEFIRLCSEEKLRIRKIKVQLNEGVGFTPIRARILKQEIRNFIRLLK